jgi:hypothetical protein
LTIAHFFKRAFHVAYVGGAERPEDGDAGGEAVESGHRRRFSLSEYQTYGIVFQRILQ